MAATAQGSEALTAIYPLFFVVLWSTSFIGAKFAQKAVITG